MKDIINQSLQKSISYKEYRDLVTQLVADESTTGNEKTEAQINYTLLNNRRMKRWDKTVTVPEEIQRRLAEFDKKVTWLVLTESWCGDAAHVIPVFNKIAELNSGIDLKLVLRDENEELMDLFLTNGSKSIPKLVMLDSESGDVIDTYGPRPSEATQMVNDYKREHGKLTPEFKEDLQRWYNQDKGQNILWDLADILMAVAPSFSL